jgi:hypothetical protein
MGPSIEFRIRGHAHAGGLPSTPPGVTPNSNERVWKILSGQPRVVRTVRLQGGTELDKWNYTVMDVRAESGYRWSGFLARLPQESLVTTARNNLDAAIRAKDPLDRILALRGDLTRAQSALQTAQTTLLKQLTWVIDNRQFP